MQNARKYARANTHTRTRLKYTHTHTHTRWNSLHTRARAHAHTHTHTRTHTHSNAEILKFSIKQWNLVFNVTLIKGSVSLATVGVTRRACRNPDWGRSFWHELCTTLSLTPLQSLAKHGGKQRTSKQPSAEDAHPSTASVWFVHSKVRLAADGSKAPVAGSRRGSRWARLAKLGGASCLLPADNRGGSCVGPGVLAG